MVIEIFSRFNHFLIIDVPLDEQTCIWAVMFISRNQNVFVQLLLFPVLRLHPLLECREKFPFLADCYISVTRTIAQVLSSREHAPPFSVERTSPRWPSRHIISSPSTHQFYFFHFISPIVVWDVFPIPYNHYTTLLSKSQALFSAK